jgi:hypothetical protein
MNHEVCLLAKIYLQISFNASTARLFTPMRKKALDTLVEVYSIYHCKCIDTIAPGAMMLNLKLHNVCGLLVAHGYSR